MNLKQTTQYCFRPEQPDAGNQCQMETSKHLKIRQCTSGEDTHQRHLGEKTDFAENRNKAFDDEAPTAALWEQEQRGQWGGQDLQQGPECLLEEPGEDSHQGEENTPRRNQESRLGNWVREMAQQVESLPLRHAGQTLDPSIT